MRSLKCECGKCRTCYTREWARRRTARETPEEREARRAREREADRVRYHRDKSKRRALADRWAAENAERTAEIKREWELRNPEKKAAIGKVNNELRHGRMVRGNCEVCGASDAQGHHDDYSKPLNVRWLCSKHHAEHHRLKRWGVDHAIPFDNTNLGDPEF